MAEEANELDDLDINVDKEEEQEQEPEYTAAEQRAIEDGWRPESEWEGDAGDFVGAKEFNVRGELMTRISSQSSQMSVTNKKVEELTKALSVLGEHHKKTAETEHKRILTNLKQEKTLALEEGDSESVVEIDDKIADLKESKKEETQQLKEDKKDVKEAASEVPKEVADWLTASKQEWYHNDRVLRGVANSVSEDYMQKHPDADILDMLKYTDKIVREEMPHKFKDTPASKASKVTEPMGGRKPKGKKFTKKDLSEDQLEVAKTFVDTGIFSNVQDYVNELASNGDLS